MDTLKPIIMLDASALKKSACSLALKYTLIDGYRAPLNSTEIEFGSAFHRFAENIVLSQGDFIHSLQIAKKYFLTTPMTKPDKAKFYTADYLGYVCGMWHEHHLEDNFEVLKDTNNTQEIIKEGDMEKIVPYPKGKPLVEMKFAISYREYDSCIIMLSGTMDKIIVHNRHGLLAIGDYKTSAAAFVDEKLAEYELDGQLLFYITALKKHIEELTTPESALYKYRGKTIAAFIDGIFIGANNRFEYKRSEVFIPKAERLSRYESLLNNVCDEIAVNLKMNYFPNDGLINGACRICNYKKCCRMPDDEAANIILNRDFIKVPYNPLQFGLLPKEPSL